MFAYHTLESGQSSGTTVTAGNSAVGGTAFDQVVADILGAVVEYTATRPRGALAIRFATGLTSAAANVIWNSALGAAAATLQFRFVIRRVSGAGGMSFARFRGGATQSVRLTFDGSGHVQIRNSSNTQVAITTAAMGASDWWLVRGTLTVGNGTGSITMYVHYDRTSATPDETFTLTGQNFGAAAVDEVTMGIFATLLVGAEVILDDILITTAGIPGPAEQTRVAPSAMTLHDTSPRAVALSRNAVTAMTLHDGAARTVAASRTALGGIGVHDLAARTYAAPRAALSAVAVHDVAARQTSANRAAPSGVSLRDAAARTVAAIRVARSGLTVHDVASRQTSATRTALSAITVHDQAAAAVTPTTDLWLGWGVGCLINGHYVSAPPTNTGELVPRHPGDQFHGTLLPFELS